MKWSTVLALVIGLSLVISAVKGGPSAKAPAEAHPPGWSSSELLPESTILAVEIRELAHRWEEIRLTPLSDVLDVLARELELELDLELFPVLLGDSAFFALIPDPGGQSVVPVLAVRPNPVTLEEWARTVSRDDSPLALRYCRGALWVGPRDREVALTNIALGDGTSFGAAIEVAAKEIDQALPEGGLMRGWLQPQNLNTFLQARSSEEMWMPLEIAATFVEAELEGLRYVGFRRELSSDRVTADAVVGYDLGSFPKEVADAFANAQLAPPYREFPEALLSVSCPLNFDAVLPWFEEVARRFPDSPVATLHREFEAIVANTEIDLQRDLLGKIVGHVEVYVANGEDGLQAIKILELQDSTGVEKALLTLMTPLLTCLAEKSFGFVLPQITRQDSDIPTFTFGLTTPLGQVAGPSFAVADRALVFGSDEAAVSRGLALLDAPRQRGSEDDGPVHGRMRLDTRTLTLVGSWLSPYVSMPAEIFTALGNSLEGLEADISLQKSSFRLHGEGIFLGK